MVGSTGAHAPRHSETSEATLDTYRALRVALVGAGLLLIFSVVLQSVRVGAVPSSISATFYSPVRGVLVSVLLAVGLALVAIKGRPGLENGLLDLAGLLVPLVGFVPTPIVLATLPAVDAADFVCPDPGVACVPADVVPGVENNAAAYGLLGVVALGYVWLRLLAAARAGQAWRSRTTRGVATATLAWAALGAWFLFGRTSFLMHAHYVCAVGFFALLTAVVWLNGRNTQPGADLLRMSERGYRRWYYGIAVTMAAAVIVAIVVFLVRGDGAVPETLPVTFWLEIVLLLAFVAFWVLQTAEHWNHTAPPADGADAIPWS
ncbi:hypothetical protein [Miniimonas sp. S16]|uniref:hypothetical protein n=1 Tax=Miniimonas sp. S16 TaxID=2171623 RepID=UPI00131F03D9|nr:hypothetical protein [Miniimonas sp. S16]